MNYRKLRRSGRITKSVPVLLLGSDTEGRVFSEETRTVMLSLHGAGVISKHKLLAEQELILRSIETGREAEIRVVGEIAAQDGAHTYGVAFVDESLDFWQMEFPPPPLEVHPAELQLQCTACGSSITVLNGDYEFDVCAIHGGLVRYCSECGFATVWSRPENMAGTTTQKRPPREEKPGPQRTPHREELEVPREIPLRASRDSQEQVPSRMESARGAKVVSAGQSLPHVEERRTATAVQERRQRVRVKVSYVACVRSSPFGDDVVTCIDMSRGGLSFWTNNAYSISAEIKIAVPYSQGVPGAAAIFMDARVVNIREAPERQMLRCGVMFMPAKGSLNRP